MPTLTPKQLAFVREYLVDKNGTQAAIRAGYSKKTAQEQASELLSKPIISQLVAKRAQLQAQKIEITAEAILEHIARIAFGDVADCFYDDGRMKPLSEIPVASRSFIAGITIKEYTEGKGEAQDPVRVTSVKLNDRLRALELLGKHLKLFADQINIDVNVIDRVKEAEERFRAAREINPRKMLE